MTAEKIRMLLDLSDVPQGETASFSEKVLRQLRAVVREAKDLRELVGDGSGDDASASHFPRIILDTPVATPRQLKWDEVGSLVGDWGMGEASGVLLPSSADYPGDLATECPLFHFLRTTAFAMTITAATGPPDDIEVGPASGDAAAWSLALDNEFVTLALTDDRWRAVSHSMDTGVRLKRTNSVNTTTGVELTVTWENEDYDSHGFWASGTEIVIPTGCAGLYTATAGAQFEPNGSGNVRRIVISHTDSGGSEKKRNTTQQPPVAGGFSNVVSVSYQNRFLEGDKLKVLLFQDSGSTLAVANSASGLATTGLTLARH